MFSFFKKKPARAPIAGRRRAAVAIRSRAAVAALDEPRRQAATGSMPTSASCSSARSRAAAGPPRPPPTAPAPDGTPHVRRAAPTAAPIAPPAAPTAESSRRRSQRLAGQARERPAQDRHRASPQVFTGAADRRRAVRGPRGRRCCRPMPASTATELPARRPEAARQARRRRPIRRRCKALLADCDRRSAGAARAAAA